MNENDAARLIWAQALNMNSKETWNMSNEATQQHEHGGRQEMTDREWAKKLADERERREVARHNELKQIAETTQNGTAKIGVDVEELKGKVDAIFEKTCTPAATSTFGKFVEKADAAMRRALPYVTVAGAAVATGYGAYRGGRYVRDSMRKRVDVSIQPVGEPVSVPKR